MSNQSISKFRKILIATSAIISVSSILPKPGIAASLSQTAGVIPIDEEFVALQYIYLDSSLAGLGIYLYNTIPPSDETQIEYMANYNLTVDQFGNVTGDIIGRATGLYFGYAIDIFYNANVLTSPVALANGFNPITWTFTSMGSYKVTPVPGPRILDENKFGIYTDSGEITQTDKDKATITTTLDVWPGQNKFPPIGDPVYTVTIMNADDTVLKKEKDNDKMIAKVSGKIKILWNLGGGKDNEEMGNIEVVLNQKTMKLKSKIQYIFTSDDGTPPNFEYLGKNMGTWGLKPPDQCPKPKVNSNGITEDYCGMTNGTVNVTVTVPEPTSTLSLLALGTLGAASTLKRKLKPSKSTEKKTRKVG